jgi:hypothetical protein
VNEATAAGTYLVNLLEADSTLNGLVTGVWRKSVPQSERFPVVKIDRLDGDDLMVVGLNRVWANMTFLVRGVVHWRGTGSVDWSEAQAIGDQIDAVLHDHEGTDGTVTVHSFREEPFDDESLESGDLFLHCGGIYRVRAQAL